MAWNNLTNNQMTSFTSASNGGFPLKPEQSHATSNKCITKSQALTKYLLKTTNLSTYADNQLIPKSVWVAANTVTFIGTRMYNTGPVTVTGLTARVYPTVGTITITGSDVTFYASLQIFDIQPYTSPSSPQIKWTMNINGIEKSVSGSAANTFTSDSFTLSAGTYNYSIVESQKDIYGGSYRGIIKYIQENITY